MQKLNKPLPVIFFTLFVNALGFGILIPIIPLLLANPHSEFYLLPAGFTIKQGYIMLGFLTAIFPFMQFFATPILGQLSDKFGRKPLLGFSLAGTFVSYMLFAFGIITKNIPLLFFSRAFDGITGGNISVAQAAIADITTPENRAKNFGLIGASFGLGFILGPYLGGKLSDPTVLPFFNAATPFWFAAILSLINVIIIILFLQETHQHKRLDLKINWAKSLINIAHAYSLKELRIPFLAFFLFFAGFTFFSTFASVFFIDKFHFSQGNVGDTFSYMGIWVALTQAGITRILARKLAEYQILRFSYIFAGAIVLTFFLLTDGWQLLFVFPFLALGIGLSTANSAALISRSVDARIQGEILGINASVQALAQTIPPVLSGFIAAALTPETPILVSGAVMLLGGAVFLLFYRQTRSTVV